MNFPNGNHICGMYYTVNSNNWSSQRAYLPQVQLKSHTTVTPVCFTTQLTQTFHNPNSEALLQVRYTFPLYDGVAVNGYTIRYASKVLKGIVKQRDVAKKTYQAAVDRGETAGLLESLPAGVFGVTLGNVPAKTDIVVEITYCGELKHDASIDGLRYVLPTSIAPRYGSYPGNVLHSNTTAKGGIAITVDVDMSNSAIRKVQSPSHPIAVSMGAISTTGGGSQAPFKPSQASATLTLGTAELAEDFVLQLLIDDISKPQAILETHPTLPNQRALMTTLVPKFALPQAHPEIVFIADQSGSMSGSKNAALVSALKVFLKSLPLGVRFNICAFGSQFNFLWPTSQAYSESNANTAITFVDSFKAQHGGTEILKPITAAFEQRLSDLPLEIMLLTDGEVWNEDNVFGYINREVLEKGSDARVFALGIGGDVSHTLVEGVARAGNGFAQFVTENEETDQKVMRMLKGALYAHTKDYELEVHYEEMKVPEEMTDSDDDFEIVEKVNDCLTISDEPAGPTANTQSTKAGTTTSFFDTSADLDKPMKTEGENADCYAHLPSIETPKLVQAPNVMPPLFPFNRTTVYLLLDPDSAQKKVASVTLRATSEHGPLELNIPVNYSDTNDVATIHQLAAKKAVQGLEEGRGWLQAAKTANGVFVKTEYVSRIDELIERECVRLGEKFQVASKWTSFVAVEDKTQEEMKLDVMELDQEQEVVQTFAGRRVHGLRVGPPMKMGLMGGAAPSRLGMPQGVEKGRMQMMGMTAMGQEMSSSSSPAQRYVAAPAFSFSNPAQHNLFCRGYDTTAQAGSGGLFGGFGSNVQSNPRAGGLFGCATSGAVSPFGGAQALVENRTPLFGSSFGAPAGSSTENEGLFSGGVQPSSGPRRLFGSSTNPCREAFRTADVSPTANLLSSSTTGFGVPPTHETMARDLKFDGSASSTSNRSIDSGHSGARFAFPVAIAPQGLSSSSLTSSPSGASYAPHAYLRMATSHSAGQGAPKPVYADGDDDMADSIQLASNQSRDRAAVNPRKAMSNSEQADIGRMHTLINLQTFSGAWAWSTKFFATLGIDPSSISKEAIGSTDPETCATALAIAFLEGKLAGKKDVWEMVVIKARAWLGKKLDVGEAGAFEVVAEAAAFLK